MRSTETQKRAQRDLKNLLTDSSLDAAKETIRENRRRAETTTRCGAWYDHSARRRGSRWRKGELERRGSGSVPRMPWRRGVWLGLRREAKLWRESAMATRIGEEELQKGGTKMAEYSNEQKWCALIKGFRGFSADVWIQSELYKIWCERPTWVPRVRWLRSLLATWEVTQFRSAN